MTDLRVREFDPADTERLVDIALAAWAPVFASFEHMLGTELAAHLRPDWRAEKARQIRSACADDRGPVLVACLDDTIVGFVTFYPNAPTPGVGEIGNNAVDPTYQNRGIAGQMYEEVFTRLREAGMQYVKVRTGGDPAHAPARAAYERVGFDRAVPSVDYYRAL